MAVLCGLQFWLLSRGKGVHDQLVCSGYDLAMGHRMDHNMIIPVALRLPDLAVRSLK